MPTPCPLCKSAGDAFYEDPFRKWSYLRCARCALIWKTADHLPSAEEERAHYGTHQNHPDDPHYRTFLDRLWAPLKSKLNLGANGLDYGSGPGPTLHLMAQEDGFDCTHYDPFFHPDESVFEKRYDFITCSETAEHFYHPAQEFEQLAELLKPGGILGVMTSMHDAETDFENWHYRRDPTHVAFYSRETFKQVADRFDFKQCEHPAKHVILLSRLPPP